MKKLMMMVAALTAATAWSAVDSLGKTPKYWYTFDGKITSQGANGLGCNWDGSYSYVACRGEKKGWVCSASGVSGTSVFAAGQQSFTFFVSFDPGSVVMKHIFCLGSRASSVNLGLGVSHSGKFAVTRWDNTEDGNNVIHRELLAAEGVPGRLHPYAVVYDATAKTLTLYSNGVKQGSVAYEGFGGETTAKTEFQFGSIWGGAAKPYDQIRSTDVLVVEDFRFYQEALTQDEVKTISAETPSMWDDPTAIEEMDEVPQYWYTWNGSVKSRGCSEFFPNWNVNAPAETPPTPASYVDCRKGGKAGLNPTQANGNRLIHDVGGSFTFFLSAALGSDNLSTLFSVGGASDSVDFALIRRSANLPELVRWNGSAQFTTMISATVPNSDSYVHPYCIRYDATTGKIALFADGVKLGEADFEGFTAQKLLPYQMMGLYGGGHSGIGSSTTAVFEDFRFYRRGLSDSEVAALSAKLVCGWDDFIPYDTNVRPKYWYTFTETAAVKRGLEDMKLDYSWNKKSFAPSGDCVFARKGRGAATALVSSFSEVFDTTGNFTLVLGARMGVKQANKDRGILLSLGKSSSSANMALCATKNGEVLLSRWALSPETKRFDLVGPVSGYDLSQFHSYAITWDGTTLRLYVDGQEKGASVDFASPTDKVCSFGSIYGGDCAWMDDGKFALEDFRLYSQALTADEIAKIAARFPVWPNGALVWNGGESGTWDMETANWLSWDAANWADQSVAFTAGASALFDTPVASLAAAAGLTASAVRFEADATLAFGANLPTVPVVTVAEGVKVVPSGIVKREKPGIACFRGVTEAVVPENADEFGNAWYLDGTNLCYGQFAPGMLLLLR